MMIEESNEYYAHIMGNRLSIILTAILCNKKCMSQLQLLAPNFFNILLFNWKNLINR